MSVSFQEGNMNQFQQVQQLPRQPLHIAGTHPFLVAVEVLLPSCDAVLGEKVGFW